MNANCSIQTNVEISDKLYGSMFILLKLRYKKIPELKRWARDALSRQKETSYIKANDSGSGDFSMRYYCNITKLIDTGIEESGT